MEAEDYFVDHVLGLTNTVSFAGKGWMYFCQTKGGCTTMWKHWFLNVCIPTIKAAAECHSSMRNKNSNGQAHRSFFTTDGEANILNQAFDVDVKAAFKDASTDYLKLGPSSTKVQQSWDAGDLFRDCL